MIEKFIIHRTHDFKSTLVNGVPGNIDDNVPIQASHPATNTYGDTLSAHFCDSNDQNQTFDGDPHLNMSLMTSSNDSTANKTKYTMHPYGEQQQLLYGQRNIFRGFELSDVDVLVWYTWKLSRRPQVLFLSLF
jgi:hypothetical protein